MIQHIFEFEKTDKNYLVEGKAKPCSSKAKLMLYITREFYRRCPDIEKGRITIEQLK